MKGISEREQDRRRQQRAASIAQYEEQRAEEVPHAQAHGIEDLVEQGPFGRTTIFNAIKSGALKAKKYGRRTVVLDPDWRSFLANLPDARAA